jgi:protein phosphatase
MRALRHGHDDGHRADPGRATILNVDSRAGLEGHVARLTTDDSWVNSRSPRGHDARRGRAHPYRNAITKGIGVDESLDPGAIVRTALVPGDVLLLCSDGLYRLVPPA